MRAHMLAMITLKAVLVTAKDELRAQLEPLTDFKLVVSCAALEATVPSAEAAMRHPLRSLALRWLQLHDEIKLHTKALKTLTMSEAPDLVEAFGIGADIAAEMLVTAGENMIASVPTPPSPSSVALARYLPLPAARNAFDSTAVGTAGQRFFASCDRRQAVLACSHDRLRAPSNRGGTVQARDHPVSQTLLGARDLPASSGTCADLTSIGASTPSRNPSRVYTRRS